jgi:hypothetical protein
MNYLQTNTASQTLLLSLEEGVLLLPSFTNYLLIIQNEITLEIFAVIPTLISSNERISTLSISTNADDAVNGSILITDGGRYNYVIYGQNSDSNLDAFSADVVGEIKRGYIEFTTLTQYFDQPSLTIPNDIEYNG